MELTSERVIRGHLSRLVVSRIDKAWEVRQLWDWTVVKVSHVTSWQHVEWLMQAFDRALDFDSSVDPTIR